LDQFILQQSGAEKSTGYFLYDFWPERFKKEVAISLTIFIAITFAGLGLIRFTLFV
jgi:hypothetical protein